MARRRFLIHQHHIADRVRFIAIKRPGISPAQVLVSRRMDDVTGEQITAVAQTQYNAPAHQRNYQISASWYQAKLQFPRLVQFARQARTLARIDEREIDL